MSKQNYAVIVDPTSSGALLAPEFHARGYECIAVHGRPLPPALIATYRHEHFCAEFQVDEGYIKVRDAIAVFEPRCVLAGNEPGVEIADRLVHDFGLVGNKYRLSKARTNKFYMQETLREAGLKSIAQHKSSDVGKLLEWLDRHDRFPVVVKPLESGGTDGVVVCSTKEEVVQSFNAIMHTKNLFGMDNQEVLIQEFIEGDEYIVDMVSCQGQHVLVEKGKHIKYRSPSGAPVYQRTDYWLLPATDEHQHLLDYNVEVLNALGIVNGCSHSEIMFTDEGPVLIEVGARMAGASVPALIAECARFSQLDLVVDTVVEPDRFFEKAKIGQEFHKFACLYFLSSYQEGVVASLPGKAEIENMPSYWRSLWRAKEGKKIDITSDLISSPGFLYLTHASFDQINSDIERIEYLEKNSLIFDVTH